MGYIILLVARNIMNELKWHPEKSLRGVTLRYIHRGAPGGVMTAKAEDIAFLEKSFILLKGPEEKRIPYHRIVEIRKAGKILWKKSADVSRSEK